MIHEKDYWDKLKEIYDANKNFDMSDLHKNYAHKNWVFYYNYNAKINPWMLKKATWRKSIWHL